ncbi:DUF6573 family protein [Streptomyces aurantiacus]|uniref:Uncharacterized protein n=1 Tax=Streptomyces aurantiacus JA 4570 TaxID=1286094 RepID=S4A804_9ACTN|nr:DUF6573 family protein [Streptomyces aurantiacus]EPH46920.1 hypothetical protein STRAU_0086 [Streptomyces aurantiacus JA 4570]
MSNSLVPGASDYDGISEDAMRWTPEQGQQGSADALTELFGGDVDVIHAYTRAQAIADGALVDVPGQLAREAGFTVPIALTVSAWADCVEWTDEDSNRQTSQDETGRLWDVLNMTRFAIQRGWGRGNSVMVELYRIPRGGKVRQPRRVQLVAHVGPGDNAGPVMTIMMPDED